MQAHSKNISESAGSFWGSSAYIRSPVYDWSWIVLSPLWAIAVGWLMSGWLFQQTVTVFDTSDTAAFFFYMALTQAHLFITVFRTHLNSQVFDRYFWRFTLIPIVLFVAAISNAWIFACLFVVMVFWDVYHSAMQVFGFGRIYDRKAGNDPNIGRFADYLLCVMMYAGPVLGGVLLISHVEAFNEFNRAEPVSVFGILLSSDRLVAIPGVVAEYQDVIMYAMLATGAVIAIAYAWQLWVLRSRGYQIPLPKLAMYSSTLVACIFAWGFNSFAMGYLIANIFHAVQYFALVWIMEQKSIGRVFHGPASFRLALFVSAPVSLGLLSVSFDSQIARALLMVCALMHFWWDGFIWSVRTPNGLPPHLMADAS